MKSRQSSPIFWSTISTVLAAVLAISPLWADDAGVPQLRKTGSTTQLVVDGRPWVMLAGELHNSSASGVEYMRRMWPHLKALGLNTVLAPDIYVGEFKEVCAAYSRAGNPLLVPEASRDDDAAARAYWVIAQHHGLGFAPFGIESVRDDHPLVETYQILRQLLPLVTAAQGTRRMAGIYREGREESPVPITVGDYKLHITYEARLPPAHPPVGGLAIQTGPREFIVAGYGFGCQFSGNTPGTQHTHIRGVEWGHFDAAGQWIHELWLNGDETGANYLVRIPPSTVNEYMGNKRPMILRVKLDQHD